jgi:hypothetical protein
MILRNKVVQPICDGYGIAKYTPQIIDKEQGIYRCGNCGAKVGTYLNNVGIRVAKWHRYKTDRLP